MTDEPDLLYLPRSALDRLSVTTVEVVEAIEHLIRGRAAGTVWNAPKCALTPDSRLFMAMLAVSDDPPFTAIKALGHCPDNAALGLPTIGALITLFDSVTGLPLALIEGNWVTGVRTAGLSAVAAKHLARPDSRSIAFIGCGVQAHSHLQAFAAMFPLTGIRAFGRGSANRDALCRAAVELGLEAVASETARSAIEGADIVVTSVPLSPDLEPFLDADWLAPGSFATITDLARSWHDEGMAGLDRVIIDDLEQEAEMPDAIAAPELVAGDLAGLVSGATAPRRDADERVVFIFRGLALGDLAVAALAYQRAREASLGTVLGS